MRSAPHSRWSPRPNEGPRRRTSLAQTALLALAALGLPLSGCAARREAKPTGLNSYGQAMRYIQKAVRRSSEGVIILPSRRTETLYDLVRLNEIAQALRSPAAACFVNRAIETVKRGVKDGETVYVDVPEGQVKIRTRLGPDGSVLRTEVLDTGFKDPEIEPCVGKAIAAQKWPPNRTGLVQYLDVVYWVSLGDGAEDRGPQVQKELRRQQAIAALRGKQCLAGRVGPGTWTVEGLSLLDREGNTLVNRVDPGPLPGNVRECLAVVFREIRLPRAPQAFVRPISPRVEYTVAEDGAVSFADEPWISLLLLEEEATREARRAELAGGEPPPVDEAPLADEPAPEPEPVRDAEPQPSTQHPGEGGIRLKLGGHRKPEP